MKLKQIRIDGDVAYVPLTKGYEAVIDAADASLVAMFNWCASVKLRANGEVRTVYAKRRERVNGRQVSVFMHRIIAGTPKGLETDHRDGNGLNNRRSNLRNATTAQNQQNRRGELKGAFWRNRRKRWGSAIKVNGRAIDLGSFRTKEEASAAYRAAKVRFHGEFGRAE